MAKDPNLKKSMESVESENSFEMDIPYVTELLKIAWGIIFVIMAITGVYMSVLLIIDYLQFSSFDVIYSKVVPSFTLPAITVCNLNPINATAVEEDNPELLELYYTFSEGHKKLKDDDTDEEDHSSLDDSLLYFAYTRYNYSSIDVIWKKIN